MQQSPEQLVVRQHERFECRIAARIRVAAACGEQVAFSRAVGDGTGALEATVVDCSKGGLGLETPIFLPRGVLLTVHPGSGPGETGVLEVRVQRATMLDRSPRFYLGVSYVGSGSEHDRAVGALLAAAARASAAHSVNAGTTARGAA